MASKVIHANVSPEAHDAWMALCTEQGVSVTGLAEALGARFAELDPTDVEATSFELIDVVREARKVDAARRRRSR